MEKIEKDKDEKAVSEENIDVITVIKKEKKIVCYL